MSIPSSARGGMRATATLVRALVLALTLPIASSGSLPLFALLAGVEAPHVCQCHIARHDCACAKCNPEHEEDLLVTTESLIGRCGDDAVAFGGKALCAVLAPAFVVVPLALGALEPLAPIEPVPILEGAPPTPPPRARSSEVV